MSVVWSITAMVIAFMFYRDRRTSIGIGLVFLSRWALDFIMHDHILPLLFSDSPSVGIGFYYSFSATGTVVHWPQALISEFGLLAAGIAVYMYKTKAKDRMGVWLLWLILFSLIVVAFVGFLLPQHLSILSGIAITLLLFFGGNWIERHRVLSPLRWNALWQIKAFLSKALTVRLVVYSNYAIAVQAYGKDIMEYG